MRDDVTFLSQGLHCSGWLYLPDNLKNGERRPAIVMAHGFSAVKEMYLCAFLREHEMLVTPPVFPRRLDGRHAPLLVHGNYPMDVRERDAHRPGNVLGLFLTSSTVPSQSSLTRHYGIDLSN